MLEPTTRVHGLSLEERNRLIEQHLPRFRLLARRLKYRLPPGASLDDLVQAAALAMIRNLDSGKPWSWTRAYGSMLDWLRANRADEELGDREPIHYSESPEQRYIRIERLRLMDRAIDRLKPKQRTFIKESFRGSPVPEIARGMRIGVRQAQKLRVSAIRELQREVMAA